MQTKTSTQSKNKNAVTCENLHFSYNFKSILQDVNLAIPHGAVVGLSAPMAAVNRHYCVA